MVEVAALVIAGLDDHGFEGLRARLSAGATTMFDFYKENPTMAAIVVVVAVAMAFAVLRLGDMDALALAVLGLVGGLVCGAVIGFARSRGRR